MLESNQEETMRHFLHTSAYLGAEVTGNTRVACVWVLEKARSAHKHWFLLGRRCALLMKLICYTCLWCDITAKLSGHAASLQNSSHFNTVTGRWMAMLWQVTLHRHRLSLDVCQLMFATWCLMHIKTQPKPSTEAQCTGRVTVWSGWFNIPAYEKEKDEKKCL